MNLVTLQFKTTNDFQKNLSKLIELIENIPINSFVLAPELCLNGYAYDKLDEANDISIQAIKQLKQISQKRTISLTLTIKRDNQYFNTLHIFHKGKIIHTQSKYKLFVLNDEKKYFTAGQREDIKIINIDGIKVAALICFELRFPELWEQIKGADIIFIPAMWGKLRRDNFMTLSKALAIANQCFVVASNSSNNNMAKGSAITSPFGKVVTDDRKEMLIQEFDLKEIRKMRKYLPVGIE